MRWAECDVQRVVFYPEYLAYVNDAVDVWMQQKVGADFLERFQYQTIKATVEWASAAGLQDVVELRPAVKRWGRTSFDVAVSIDIADRHVADAELVLVSVTPGTLRPTPVPNDVRQALG